jgi:hypothetical protein
MLKKVTITRAQERLNFTRGIEGQVRIMKEAHMFNFVKQKNPLKKYSNQPGKAATKLLESANIFQ